MNATILTGDVLDKLRTLPDTSVQCVVTSPPYYGLRDYGVPGQIGLEPTPAAYVARLVEVFREVRRVLREDGVCWLNLGDSYASSWPAPNTRRNIINNPMSGGKRGPQRQERMGDGLKEKDLIGIPWRVAFALQDDGWWLRSDIIWAKPNPMPESVTDRPTKAHEYIFLLTKAARYFWDAEAIREENSETSHTGGQYVNEWKYAAIKDTRSSGMRVGVPIPRNGRNARSVWTIATQPYPEAHFATFPEELPRRCIMAGTSAHGCCPECGAPWERVVEREGGTNGDNLGKRPDNPRNGIRGSGLARPPKEAGTATLTTTGWRATCAHDAAPIPCTVLDPFAGSGTALAVALALGRNAIGIELNPEYVKLAERRLAGVTPALFGV